MFQNYLVDHDPKSIIARTVDNLGLSATKRLQIYFDAYRLRLLDILVDDYPKVHTLMGDDAFYTLSNDYISDHPSQFFSVRYFGQSLAQYLRNSTLYFDHPYLAEMADFEWLISNTLDASDQPILGIDALHKLTPDQWGELSIEFHPSLQIITCEWDVPQLWQAIEEETPPRNPIKQVQPVTWMLWRKGLQSHFRSLSHHTAYLLNHFKNREQFGDICEGLCEYLDEALVPQTALGFLQQSLEDGIVSKFCL